MMLAFADFWGQKYASPIQYLFTRIVSQRIGSIIAYLGYRAKASPDLLTIIGMGLMLTASGYLGTSFSQPAHAYVALVLYQLAFGFDCADGQLARATQTSSAFGFWLDHACDQVRMVSVLLAIGALFVQQADLPNIWTLSALLISGSGLFVLSHTTLMLMRDNYQPHGMRRGKDRLIIALITNITDAPVFLLCICLLAWSSAWLSVYATAYGVLCLFQAIGLAMLRIKQSG